METLLVASGFLIVSRSVKTKRSMAKTFNELGAVVEQVYKTVGRCEFHDLRTKDFSSIFTFAYGVFLLSSPLLSFCLLVLVVPWYVKDTYVRPKLKPQILPEHGTTGRVLETNQTTRT